MGGKVFVKFMNMINACELARLENTKSIRILCNNALLHALEHYMHVPHIHTTKQPTAQTACHMSYT